MLATHTTTLSFGLLPTTASATEQRPSQARTNPLLRRTEGLSGAGAITAHLASLSCLPFLLCRLADAASSLNLVPVRYSKRASGGGGGDDGSVFRGRLLLLLL